jgi:hypothetical protein
VGAHVPLAPKGLALAYPRIFANIEYRLISEGRLRAATRPRVCARLICPAFMSF